VAAKSWSRKRWNDPDIRLPGRPTLLPRAAHRRHREARARQHGRRGNPPHAAEDRHLAHCCHSLAPCGDHRTGRTQGPAGVPAQRQGQAGHGERAAAAHPEVGEGKRAPHCPARPEKERGQRAPRSRLLIAEVAAITGQSLQMIEHYAKERDRAELGRSAILKFEARNKS
jgi:hypothetical protein